MFMCKVVIVVINLIRRDYDETNENAIFLEKKNFLQN